jgi:class 3 adenylate cyclase
MEAAHATYDFQASIVRIQEILNASDADYADSKTLPARASLTFTNGYYVDVTVLFVDIRESKQLSETHTRPVLAKIYRAFISEIVAVLRGHSKVSEVYIEGDGVWAVFDTPYKTDIDEALSTAARVSSLVDILNIKLAKKNYSPIKIGMGIDYGECLYIKAGYKGSGINEVVWVGKVVGQAAALCKHGNRTLFDAETLVSTVIYQNLKQEYKDLLRWSQSTQCYSGNIINIVMSDWVNENG